MSSHHRPTTAMEQHELDAIVQATIEQRENEVYEQLRAGIFGLAAETSCSVPTVLGWLRVVSAELESTILEDSPVDDDSDDSDDNELT